MGCLYRDLIPHKLWNYMEKEEGKTVDDSKEASSSTHKRPEM